MLSHDEGDLATAKSQLREALSICITTGNRYGMPEALEACGGVLLDLARPADAARLCGRAQRLREEINATLVALERRRVQHVIERGREAMQDAAAFDRAWDEGRSLTLEEAVRIAMED
jgi:hypothetical protein